LSDRVHLVILNEIGEPYTVQPDIQELDLTQAQTRTELLGAISDMVEVMTFSE
jgi:hypothetical protein